MKTEAIASYPIKCEGVSATSIPPLKGRPVDISITVFKNGSRDVGCVYLKDGNCLAAKGSNTGEGLPCAHLNFRTDKSIDLSSEEGPKNVFVSDRGVFMNRAGLSLLATLHNTGGGIVPTRDLYSLTWKEDVVGEKLSRKQYTRMGQRIKELRRFLGRNRQGYDFLSNIYGQGYFLNDPDNEIRIQLPQENQ